MNVVYALFQKAVFEVEPYPSPPRSIQSDSQFKGPLSTSELLRPDVADKSMSGEEPVDAEKPNPGSPLGEMGQ